MKKIKISKYIFTSLLSVFVLNAVAQNEILLWPNGAPGSEGKTGEEKVTTSTSGERSVSNVHRPSVISYLPAKNKATGVAIIIAPGGGHVSLKIDHEGAYLAKFLNEHGIAAFVLKNRLAREPGSTYNVDGDAEADMQRSIRLVKSRAAEWDSDTARIGVLGFSAGGELAGLSAMRFDSAKLNSTDIVDLQSSRPSFQALIYPGSILRLAPVKNSPPLFLTGGFTDRDDISKGMALLYLKYKEAGIPAELHIYATAGHGFGVRETTKGAVSGWTSRLYEWLIDIKMLKK
ncbi:MAG: alpha/beta hydrolase [Bacteroidota bacterium]